MLKRSSRSNSILNTQYNSTQYNSTQYNSTQYNSIHNSPSANLIPFAAMSEQKCRICSEGTETGKELFTPCKCSGELAYVHQDCQLQLMIDKDSQCHKCHTPIVVGSPLDFQPEIQWSNYATYAGYMCELPFRKAFPAEGRFLRVLYSVLLVLGILFGIVLMTVLFTCLGFLASIGALLAFCKPWWEEALLIAWETVPLSEKGDLHNLQVLYCACVKWFLFWVCASCVVCGIIALRDRQKKEKAAQAEPQNVAGSLLYAEYTVTEAYSLWNTVKSVITSPICHFTDIYKDYFLIYPSCWVLSIGVVYAAGSVGSGIILVLSPLVLSITKLILYLIRIPGVGEIPFFWVPQTLTGMFFKYAVIVGIVSSVVELSTSESENVAFYLAIKEEHATLIATLLLPYLHSMALYAVMTNHLILPNLRTLLGLSFWLVGLLLWWDRSNAEREVAEMISRIRPGKAERKDGAVRLLIEHGWQFVKMTLELGLMVWVFRIFGSKFMSLPFSFSVPELSWAALVGTALFIPAAKDQAPLAYVALLWIRNLGWMRLTCAIVKPSSRWLAPISELMMVIRTINSVLILGVLPLLIGRGGFAAYAAVFGARGHNDFLLWGAGLAFELPILGSVIMRWSPLEVKDNRHFQDWQDEWAESPAIFIRWRSILVSLAFVAVRVILEFFAPVVTAPVVAAKMQWTTQLAVFRVITLFWWDDRWVLFPFLATMVGDKYNFLQIVMMLAATGEWRGLVDLIHGVMRKTYPHSLINYSEQGV